MLLAPSVVLRAAWATPVMFWAISLLPLAASATLRLISLVVAVCSSTALAIVFWMSLIWLMILPIWPMASTAPLVSVWIASILWLMSSVALAVCLASSLTSLATTAKPLPASPARAASMVAFSASRLVCWAMRRDDLDDVADLGAALAELGDGGVGRLGDLDGRGGHPGGLVGVPGDLLDAGSHFLGAGGDGGDVLAHLFGRGRGDIGLRRGFLGIRRHLLADGSQLLRRTGQDRRALGDLPQESP